MTSPGEAHCESCGVVLTGGTFGGLCARCLILDGDMMPAGNPPGAELAAAEVQSALDDYAVYELIGRGGMGLVYRARQMSLNREVALKLLPGGGLDPEFAARFTREAQITARLDHPSIVPVHEMGYDAQGRGYYTMRLVTGRGLGDVFRMAQREEEGWTLPRAAGVMVKVCQAVAYAHGKGVVHRDLKPANIMAGALGEVYVMDWGLAKQKEEGVAENRSGELGEGAGPETLDLPSSSLSLTLSGAVFGTPAYMAPEQARGQAGEVDFLSDVYSLGAMLYEMLAGHPPYLPAGSHSTPQEVLAAVAHEPPADLRKLRRETPPELAAICHKAMHRDRSLRYDSALALAGDLQAWLEGRVVQAHRTGVWPELQKWVRRNRAVAISAAVAIMAAAAGLTATAIIQTRSAHRVQAALEDQEKATQLAQEALADARMDQGLRDSGEGQHARAALWFTNAADAAPHDAGRAAVNSLRATLSAKEGPRVIRALQGPALDLLRRVELHPSGRWMLGQRHPQHGAYLADLENETLPDLGVPQGLLHAAAWSPDGRELAVARTPGVVELLAVPDFTVTTRIPLPQPEATATALAWSADGRLLFLGGSPSAVWDRDSGALLPALLPHPNPPWAGVFSPDGKNLLTITQDGSVRRWPVPPDGAPQSPVETFGESFNRQPFFSADGSQFFVMTDWSALRIFDTATLAKVAERNTESGICDISADGRLWAGQASVETAEGQVVLRQLNLGRARFSPDASLVFSSIGGLVHPLDGKAGPLRLESQSGAACGAFTQDGSRLVTVQGDGLIRVWQLRQDTGRTFIPLPEPSRPAVSADSRWLATCGESSWGQSAPTREVRFFSLTDGTPAAPAWPLPGELINGAFSPDATRYAIAVSTSPDRGAYQAAAVRQDGHVELLDWQAGKRATGPVAMPSEPRDIAWSADGRSLAVMCGLGEVVRVDAATGAAQTLFQMQATLPAQNERTMENGSVAFTPDGRTLVAWGVNREVALWDWHAARMAAPLLPMIYRPRDVVFHGDTMVAVQNNRIHAQRAPWFFHSTNGAPLPSGLAFECPDWASGGRFSEDGRLFLLSGLRLGLKLWDWSSGTPVCPDMPVPEGSNAAFIPGTPWILSTGALSGETFTRARLWDRRTGRPVSPDWLLEGPEPRGLVVSPDGRLAVTSDYSPAPGFHVLRLPGASPGGEPLPPEDLRTLRRLNAGGHIELGGFIRQTSGEFLSQWREFRRRHPGYHVW